MKGRRKKGKRAAVCLAVVSVDFDYVAVDCRLSIVVIVDSFFC